MLVAFDAAQGVVHVEAEGPDGPEATGLVDQVVRATAGELGDISRLVGQVVVELASGLRAAAHSVAGSLDRAELELGIKVDAEGRAFIARGHAGANITLRLTWDLSPTPP